VARRERELAFRRGVREASKGGGEASDDSEEEAAVSADAAADIPTDDDLLVFDDGLDVQERREAQEAEQREEQQQKALTVRAGGFESEKVVHTKRQRTDAEKIERRELLRECQCTRL